MHPMRPSRRFLRYSSVCMPLSVVFVLAFLGGGCSRGPGSFPATEKKPVTDVYYGINVVDNYRWLDDLKDPAVRKWNDEQNAYSRDILDRVPGRDAIIKRLAEITQRTGVRYSGLRFRGKLFAMKSVPTENQPYLVALKSPDDTTGERIVINLNALNPKGRTAIDWYVPSRDGKLVAASLSENGSEDGTVYVFDVDTGMKLRDAVPGAQFPTGGGSLEWNADATGFYYTRYPQGDERPSEDKHFYQQIYFHRLGTTPDQDTYVLGKDFPRIAECTISSTGDGRYILVRVANGDGGDFEHFLLGPSGKWIQITTFADRVVSAEFSADNSRLFLLSYKNAPNGTVLVLPLANPKLSAARVFVRESSSAMASFIPGAERLYVVYIVGGPMQVQVFNLQGKPERMIPLPDISAVGGMIRYDNMILIELESFVQPEAWYRYDPRTGNLKKTLLAETSTVDFSDIEVTREYAISEDGTRVPMNILKRKDVTRNGERPTILYGYGGYGVSQSPSFSATRYLWLEQGGIYVVANLRGGAEFGQSWHEAGRLTKKQNVFDDFAACAKHLIDTGYTNPAHLAIRGGSNGGLLMGAALTQHPELFRAVVSSVGIYDMLRVELFPNGAFNVTEFGTVKDPAQFKALFAYSPYHHVVDGTAYPAVLFMTGDNDGRVDPANSRKMTARLQAATSSGLPILLRTNAHAGHGIGTGLSDRLAQDADMYCFLFDQLKVPYKPVEK